MDLQGGQVDEWWARRGRWPSQARLPLLDAETHQKGRREQHESHMSVPAEVAAHFIVRETESFARLQVLFDVPACADGLHAGGQRRGRRSKNQIVRQLMWRIETATDQQEVAFVHDPGL